MGTHNKVQDNVKKKMCKLRKQGKTCKEIGKILGLHYTTVAEHTRHLTEVKLPRGIRIDEKKKAKAIKLKKENFTIQEISEILDISVGTVINYTKGVSSTSNKVGVPINFSYEQIREMEEMRRGGVTNNKIAHHFNCSTSTVHNKVKHITPVNKGRKRKLNKENRQEMIILHYEEGWTQQRIADYFKVSNQTISRELKKYSEGER